MLYFKRSRALIGVFLFLSAAHAMASSLNKIVVFGDSLSDNGNLYEYMGHNMPMSPPYYKGRFTDGPVWIEHLAKHYFPEHPEAHLLDYAFGGAAIDNEDADDMDDEEGDMSSLDRGLDSYLLAHNGKADTSSLYVIWIGSNNYLALPDALDAEVAYVRTGLRRAVDRLVDKGAKHIMLVGLPDLGKTPMAGEFEAEANLTYLSNQHNMILEEDIQKLRETRPEVEWFFLNVNEMFLEAINHPLLYDFVNVTSACNESLDYMPSAQSTSEDVLPTKLGGLNTLSCNQYLFFDQLHPSGRGHEYIALEGEKVLDAARVKFSDEVDQNTD
jgi:phospholipase/lecithinase/hemolysin